MNRKGISAFIYFTISTIITWWFIEASPIYESTQQKLLSCSIAGAKWGIQLLAAFILLKEKKWGFIKNISIVCLMGSLLLLPYAALGWFFHINGSEFFAGSLLLTVAVMILLYAMAVRNAGVAVAWWLGWLGCLGIAILLQLTVVFQR
ncbi:MAG: hypothetical protein H7Y86_03300 [Rhizobacter sp.]|nr:hypothetical protein [Ferruginibacter sp.]